MTGVAPARAGALVPTTPASTAHQVATLARRSMRRTLRQPAAIFPSILLPLILLAINASGLADADKIPGFPPGASYLDFIFAMPFMQAALFATVNAGSGLAQDIEGGFLNRLALTPMRGAALVLGQLAGAVLVALIAMCSYLLFGLVTGVDIVSGPLGVVVLVLQAMLIALAFASFGAFLALRTGSGEAVQGMFPLMFVTFFLSSVSLPRDVIEVDWFRTVATWNPVSYMVEGMRGVVVYDWDMQAVGLGVLVSGGMAVLMLALSGRALRDRLVRT